MGLGRGNEKFRAARIQFQVPLGNTSLLEQGGVRYLLHSFFPYRFVTLEELRT